MVLSLDQLFLIIVSDLAELSSRSPKIQSQNISSLTIRILNNIVLNYIIKYNFIMQQIVSITSQGQVSLPQPWLRVMGITGAVKAVAKKQGGKIVIEPKKDFWSLAGSLKSTVTATDKQLKRARTEFSKQWPQP